jgi:predicted O-linked N-acetylglucosamine transferase (SPINDLY family)
MSTLAEAVAFFQAGKRGEAELACERLLARSIDDQDALLLLAEIHLSTGRLASAIVRLQRLVELRPADAATHRRLGSALLSDRRAADAADCLRKAVGIDPANARAHNNLGQALLQLGKLEAAIECFAQALRLDPAYAIAHHNLGLGLTAAGDLERASQSFARAIAHAPLLVDAWVARGSVLSQQRRFDDALAAFDEALRLDERRAETHQLRAGALRKLNRYAEALRALERALELDPSSVGTWGNRAIVCHELGDFEAATACYRRAVELDPGSVMARARLLASLIPSVPESPGELLRARTAFDAELNALETWLESRDLDRDDAMVAAQQQFFYLSYEEQSNRSLLERYRRAGANRLARFALPPASRNAAEARSPRFRLGFVSAQVFDHSVFTAILRGWLECLDRSRFEIHLFDVGDREDATTLAARGCVDRYESGARSTTDWAASIAGSGLDALIYPEIGMHYTSLGLANLRLAPRQLAAWGHPETSGLPSIDAYLSAESFEPPDAEEHYSEQLIRLPNLGVHCRPYGIGASALDLAQLGIPEDRPVFLCAGVPFKYRPQDDWVLVEIARRVGRCSFVFFTHDKAALSDKLLARISAAFRGAMLDPTQFLVLIPWQPRAAFFTLMRRADVFLDTIGFSGFNTMMQAVECHLPCVGYEGRYLRGRLGSGILRRLGLDDWVAPHKEQYVDLAVRLATSAPLRAEVREKMRVAEPRLYADFGAVDALAELLLDPQSLL